MLWTPAYMGLCLETLSLPCRIWTINVHCTWCQGISRDERGWILIFPFAERNLFLSAGQNVWAGLIFKKADQDYETFSNQSTVPHAADLLRIWGRFRRSNYPTPAADSGTFLILCVHSATKQSHPKKKERDLLEKPVLSISPEVRRKWEKSQLLRLDSSGLMLCNCSQRLV